MTYDYPMTPSEASDKPRGPGRPRKWATEADRARAYRERRAEEHASADELRLERRELKRQLSDAVRGRQRAEEALRRENARAERLAVELDHARKQLGDAQATIDSLRTRNEELLAKPSTTPRPIDTAPGLSRQQRRAMARNKRNRKR